MYERAFQQLSSLPPSAATAAAGGQAFTLSENDYCFGNRKIGGRILHWQTLAPSRMLSIRSQS